MSYKIVKEDKDDFKQSRIEQNDSVVEFSIADADARQADYLRLEVEWGAQISLCKAQIDNITRNHKEIAELDPVKMNAASLFLENKQMLEEYEPKLEQLKKAIKKYEVQRAEILKNFDWKEEVTKEDGQPEETKEDVPESK